MCVRAKSSPTVLRAEFAAGRICVPNLRPRYFPLGLHEACGVNLPTLPWSSPPIRRTLSTTATDGARGVTEGGGFGALSPAFVDPTAFSGRG